MARYRASVRRRVERARPSTAASGHRQQLEARGERARQAATRHDERAAEAEGRLEQL